MNKFPINLPKLKEITAARMTKFMDGNPCLMVTLKWEDGYSEEIAACVNHWDEKPSEGCIFGRSYSEGERIYHALVQAGVLTPTGRIVQSGFVTLPECKVNL